MRKTLDEKLFLINQSKSGVPITRLAKEHHVRFETILKWVRKYDRYGPEGLRSKPLQDVPKEIKEEILYRYFEESISLPWLAVEANLSETRLKRWVKEAGKSGRWAGRDGHRVGRPSVEVEMRRLLETSGNAEAPKPGAFGKTCGQEPNRRIKYMGRKKRKQPQTRLERLEYENLRLRAENALLKKVHALVLEKKMRRNGQEPSTD